MGERKANPFTEQVAGPFFVGREDQLKVFQTNLAGLYRNQPNHMFVVGLEGTGKTSYLYKLKEIAEQQDILAAVFPLDLGNTDCDQMSVVLRSIIKTIQKRLAKTNSATFNLLEEWDKGETCTYFMFPRTKIINSSFLQDDFRRLEMDMISIGVKGIVVCVDEGQRILPTVLSAIKNAIQPIGSFLIVLSLRLSSISKTPVEDGKALLEEKAAAAEGDLGAARFYVSGTAIGPFVTDHEIASFFFKRLEKNIIRFTGDVPQRIGSITGRIPRNMIQFASHIYNEASARAITDVDTEFLNGCFRDMFREQMDEAITLRDMISNDVMLVLRSLLSFVKEASADQVAHRAYGQENDQLAEAVRATLRRIIRISPIVREINDKFLIADPERRYAIDIATQKGP